MWIRLCRTRTSHVPVDEEQGDNAQSSRKDKIPAPNSCWHTGVVSQLNRRRGAHVIDQLASIPIAAPPVVNQDLSSGRKPKGLQPKHLVRNAPIKVRANSCRLLLTN